MVCCRRKANAPTEDENRLYKHMLECYSNPFFALNSLSVMRWLKIDLILIRLFSFLVFSFVAIFHAASLVLSRIVYLMAQHSCVNPICKKCKKNCQAPSPVLCQCVRVLFRISFHSHLSFFDFFFSFLFSLFADDYLFLETNSIHIIPLREWIVSFSSYVQYNLMFGRKILCLPFCTLIEQKIRIRK